MINLQNVFLTKSVFKDRSVSLSDFSFSFVLDECFVLKRRLYSQGYFEEEIGFSDPTMEQKLNASIAGIRNGAQLPLIDTSMVRKLHSRDAHGT